MLEDFQIVALVKNGNVDSFADIVERYQSPVFRYVYRLTGSNDIAQDLTQDTFVQAFEGLLKTEINVSFKAWLYRIATNNVLQLWRRKQVLSFIPLKEDSRNRDFTDTDRSEAIGIQLDVQVTLAKIPGKQRICMVLHFVEGFKYHEIAIALGISEEAVRKRVARGSLEFKRLYDSREVQ
ncbi:MAG: hypothetical protein A2158_02235 [Chloroflexi bacterium RBG_13_46_14]|nr:MAG: hypothetical protein A2158_02235 [Chloroflexi bacterium RBG_13_46_14]